mmetsp:Transcript_11157/g.16391  ORF Transcript_11157/g.16391 Transcript_11157/m.16391 type:complete len:150 (+) Transcript_11157:343-792(+)
MRFGLVAEVCCSLVHDLLKKFRAKMYKESTTISFRNTNVLIHINKVKVSSLGTERERKRWKFPILKRGSNNITRDSPDDNFAIATHIKIFCNGIELKCQPAHCMPEKQKNVTTEMLQFCDKIAESHATLKKRGGLTFTADFNFPLPRGV